MRISAAIVGLGAAALVAAGAPAAYADTTTPPPPSYGPITLSPQESQHLCADVLPKLIDRRNKLTARINGDANTKGSVAWLKARAQSQRDKGHTQIADRLTQRADKRQSRLGDLAKAEQQLTDFKNAHCQAK
ncbi:MAG TPA: hypothetical protein VHC18_09310 [Amycolatopsis sp.]|nr:hypothetical protein [Amycolatopsis sp.]